MLEYLAATPNSFLQLVTDDLRWFFTTKELVNNIPDIEGGLADIVDWISDSMSIGPARSSVTRNLSPYGLA